MYPNQPPPQGHSSETDYAWSTGDAGVAGPPAGAPGYPPMPPGGGYPGGYVAPPQRGVNGFAIASLVLGLMGGFLLAVPFGIVALNQIKSRQQQGRGLAIGGLVASGVWALVFVVAFVVGAAGGPERNSLGEVTDAGDESVFDVRTGDCIDGLNDDTGKLFTVQVTPCGQAHDAEVITEFELPAGAWPGEQSVISQAEQMCVSKLELALGNSPVWDSLGVYYLYPVDSVSWSRSREVDCLVNNVDGSKLVGEVPR